VYDRRDDGFHELRSLFQALSFGDSLRFESLKSPSVCEIQMPGAVPPESNLIHKAIAAFRARTGWSGGVRVTVEKRIPMGAGLGGGSSDAAAALLAVNELSGCRLPLSELAPIAAALGSDIPFFLFGGCALAEGRGERLRGLPARTDYAVVLVNPGFPSDTARAYRLLDLARAAAGTGRPADPSPAVLEAALSGPVSLWPFANDFRSAFEGSAPAEGDAYRRLLDDLRSAGAEFVELSGSGSTCFGVFSDPDQAASAALRLKNSWSQVEIALPLARSNEAVLH
jgi:4-diphosphocytidyl-2-C-methyl-D-erythritol kinase